MATFFSDEFNYYIEGKLNFPNGYSALTLKTYTKSGTGNWKFHEFHSLSMHLKKNHSKLYNLIAAKYFLRTSKEGNLENIEKEFKDACKLLNLKFLPWYKNKTEDEEYLIDHFKCRIKLLTESKTLNLTYGKEEKK
jgi:hypothetical protein